MKRVLVCTGVLGGGTALVFAAASIASAMFPDGGSIAASNQFMMMKGGMAAPGGVFLGGNANFGAGGTITTVNPDGSTTTITTLNGTTTIAGPAPSPNVAPDASTGP